VICISHSLVLSTRKDPLMEQHLFHMAELHGKAKDLTLPPKFLWKLDRQEPEKKVLYSNVEFPSDILEDARAMVAQEGGA
jgi:hypothetical protein